MYGSSCDGQTSCKQVAVVILCPAANAQSVTKFNLSLGAVTELTSKFYPQSSHWNTNSQNWPKTSFPSLGSISRRCLSHCCTIFVRKVLPYLSPTFTRRTSGHNLCFFRTVQCHVSSQQSLFQYRLPLPPPKFISQLSSSHCAKSAIILSDNLVCHSPPLLRCVWAFGRVDYINTISEPTGSDSDVFRTDWWPYTHALASARDFRLFSGWPTVLTMWWNKTRRSSWRWV